MPFTMRARASSILPSKMAAMKGASMASSTVAAAVRTHLVGRLDGCSKIISVRRCASFAAQGILLFHRSREKVRLPGYPGNTADWHRYLNRHFVVSTGGRCVG